MAEDFCSYIPKGKTAEFIQSAKKQLDPSNKSNKDLSIHELGLLDAKCNYGKNVFYKTYSVFNQLDTDKDGKISSAELEPVAVPVDSKSDKTELKKQSDEKFEPLRNEACNFFPVTTDEKYKKLPAKKKMALANADVRRYFEVTGNKEGLAALDKYPVEVNSKDRPRVGASFHPITQDILVQKKRLEENSRLDLARTLVHEYDHATTPDVSTSIENEKKAFTAQNIYLNANGQIEHCGEDAIDHHVRFAYAYQSLPEQSIDVKDENDKLRKQYQANTFGK